MTKLYKIRQLTFNNATGDAYGITIPQQLNANFSGTYFSIDSGDNIIQSIEIEIIDKMSVSFKQMSIDIPSEYYPQIKRYQIEIGQHIITTLDNLKNSIILESGCKEGVNDAKKRKNSCT